MTLKKFATGGVLALLVVAAVVAYMALRLKNNEAKKLRPLTEISLSVAGARASPPG